MSLARAFTTRRNRNESMSTPFIGRAASQRSPNSKPIQRSQISLPVALISTTNMLSYDAPDIAGTPRIVDRKASSSSSVASGSTSGDESDASSASVRSRDTTITVASSVDSYVPGSPEQNHLSCYFKPSVATSNSPSSTASTISSEASFGSPSIPQRAPSHSKRAHERLSHKRSVQRTNAPPVAMQDKTRESIDMFSAASRVDASASHPFGKELEQLSEVAEEFGSVVRDAEAEADRAVMQSRGLVQFCAADYLSEISGLYGNVWAEDAMTFNAPVVGWI